MRSSTSLALAASIGSALAQIKGFNYGATNTDQSVKTQSDFENEFNAAKALVGASGFTSARLYTTIQGGESTVATSAIPAAISTNTTLLLGLWGSGGQTGFSNELTALSAAVSQYGTDFTDLVVGISVGSEDLYRISPTGVLGSAGNPGAEPATIADYISQTRSSVANNALKNVPVGHVDTWTAWVNGSNQAVIDACDFIGMDAYPYFQNTQSNDITSGQSLFQSALAQTQTAVGSKSIWITETGWPVSGKTENLAVPSPQNAQTYWDDVGCNLLFGKVNTWWYTLQDAFPTTPNPSFGVLGADLNSAPLYDLSCSSDSSSASSSSAAATTSQSVAPVSTPASQPAGTVSIASPVPAASYDASASGPAASGNTASVSSPAASGNTASVSSPAASGNTASESVAASSGSGAAAITSGLSGPASPVASGTVSISEVTTGSSVEVAGPKTLTVYQTTLITITGCSTTVCPTTLSSAVATSPASAPVSAPATNQSASSAAQPSASASGCPANLNGDYQYPHLIVPVSSESPSTAYGTQYNGTINSTVSTIFNFDIPASYAGKSCSLVFLFPELSQLETSSYEFNGQGGIVSHVLSSAANASTTYANAGSQVLENGSISSLQSGNSYVISSDSCPAGTAVSFELSSTGGLALEFFEDYNPSPLGLYVVAC